MGLASGIVIVPGVRARTRCGMWVWGDRNEYVGEVPVGAELTFLSRLGVDLPRWAGVSPVVAAMYAKMEGGGVVGWVAPTDLEEIEKSVPDVVGLDHAAIRTDDGTDGGVAGDPVGEELR